MASLEDKRSRWRDWSHGIHFQLDENDNWSHQKSAMLHKRLSNGRHCMMDLDGIVAISIVLDEQGHMCHDETWEDQKQRIFDQQTIPFHQRHA